MEKRFWSWLLLAACLVAGLSGCLGSSSSEGGPARATAAPAATTAVPTPEVVGQFSEYRLELKLDPTAARLVGRQQVRFPNHTGVPLDEIVFRLYPNLPQYGGQMVVASVLVGGREAAFSLRAGNTALAVSLPSPLAPEKAIDIEMVFNVAIPSPEEGYVLFGHSQGIWSLPDAYPLLAVHDGHRWHEDVAPPHGDAVFAEAALYDVTLTLPAALTLVATGSLLDETVGPEGQRTYHLGGAPLREFTWLASSEYEQAETRAQGTVVRSYYLPGDEAAGKATLATAAAALRAYVESFGAYPYPEMLVVEAPLLFYGMEYPGVNLIGTTLYGERRAQLEDRVVHEIAHQWWYAQVGNDQVNTPWLDEGLAEYSMATYYRQVYGEARTNTLINQRWLVPYQTAVENDFDAVVNQPSAAFGQEYEIMVYAKAALFFDALRRELGDDVYQAVLRAYLEQYRWRIATPDDFLAVAEAVSGQDVDGLYNRWILSKQ